MSLNRSKVRSRLFVHFFYFYSQSMCKVDFTVELIYYSIPHLQNRQANSEKYKEAQIVKYSTYRYFKLCL